MKFRLERCFTLLFLLLIAGCTRSTPIETVIPEQVFPEVFTAELPGIPLDQPLPRSASAPLDLEVLGNDEFDRSAQGANHEGSQMTLNSTSGGPLAWAIYCFDTGGHPLLSVDVELDITSGEAWLAVADYTQQRWDFSGPFSADPDAITLSADNLSPGGNLYIGVLAYGETLLGVVSATAVVDVTEPDPLYIRGRVTDGGGSGISGVTMFIPFLNISTLTDAQGNYLLEGLNSNDDLRLIPSHDEYSFTPNILFEDFSASLDDVDFEGTLFVMPPEVSYASHMRPMVFEPICMNCHNSAYSGEKRQFAPPWVNWDTYDGTTEFYKNLGNTRAQNETMPPFHFGSLKLNDHQKELFQGWVDGAFLP